MKTTMENVLRSYEANMEALTRDNKFDLNAIDHDIELVYSLVGKFKTTDAYEKRIRLFMDDDAKYESLIKDCKADKSKSIRIENLARALLANCLKGEPVPFCNPEDKVATEPAKPNSEPVNETQSTNQTNINITELFNKSVYIKASGFRGAMLQSYGKLDDVYNATETNIPESMKPMMNRLLELVAFSAAKGFETIVTGYENNDYTNTFIYFLSRSVDMYNANTNKKKVRLIVLRGKECNVNLKENIDYCVTGNFNSSPVVIQKHGIHVRKITELLNDARQARTFKVYNGEIFLDGARVPVMPYLRELNYRNCGLSEQGFKRAFKYCVPLVSGNNATKLEKKTLKYDHKTTLQMIKDFNISTCIYIGNHVDSYKEILKKNTKVTSYKGYNWDVILNDIPAQEAAAYSDHDIVSDGLPLGQ